jgi:hypothetical protein
MKVDLTIRSDIKLIRFKINRGWYVAGDTRV